MFEDQQKQREREASLQASLHDVNKNVKRILAIIFLITFVFLFLTGLGIYLGTTSQEDQTVGLVFMGISGFSLIFVLLPILVFWKPNTKETSMDYVKKKALSFTGNQNNPYAMLYIVETMKDEIARLEEKIDELHQEIKKISR